MTKALGIDIGSLTTKAVIVGDDGVLASSTAPTIDTAESSARATAQQALSQLGLDFDSGLHVVSTGVGGKSVSFSQPKAITTCLARGGNHLVPSARMIIDIGAESITIVKVNERGRVSDWGNQDKCAAGTGIFIQQMARLMHLSLEEMAALSLEATARADISSTCAVFAESEVISHVHRVPPTPKQDIAAGIYFSMAHRILGLCKRIGIQKDVAVTGGVALNTGLVRILGEELGDRILMPQMPQTVAALGAAIIARENAHKGEE